MIRHELTKQRSLQQFRQMLESKKSSRKELRRNTEKGKTREVAWHGSRSNDKPYVLTNSVARWERFVCARGCCVFPCIKSIYLGRRTIPEIECGAVERSKTPQLSSGISFFGRYVIKSRAPRRKQAQLSYVDHHNTAEKTDERKNRHAVIFRSLIFRAHALRTFKCAKNTPAKTIYESHLQQ